MSKIHFLLHFLHGPTSPEGVLEIQLDEERREIREPESQPRDAPEQEEHREGPPDGAQLEHFLVAHRGNRDGCHVRVEHRSQRRRRRHHEQGNVPHHQVKTLRPGHRE